jgi:hypothetical protein
VDDVVSGAAAADPDIAALRQVGKVQRHAGQRELLRIVVGATGLREGLDLEAAADILYAIGSPETYQLLVTDRGWSPARFEAWYGETLDRLLLSPEDHPDQAPQESERSGERHQDDQADDQQRP